MNNIFIVFIFHDGISVDWTRFGARENISHRFGTHSHFWCPLNQHVFPAHPGDMRRASDSVILQHPARAKASRSAKMLAISAAFSVPQVHRGMIASARLRPIGVSV